MSDEIDLVLEEIEERNELPVLIEVGATLHSEFEAELNFVFGGDLSSVTERGPDLEVEDYRGIPVVLMEGAPLDYLNIITKPNED